MSGTPMTDQVAALVKTAKEVDVLDYLVPAGGVNSGDVVQVAGKTGVALHSALEGEVIGADISRAFRFPNDTIAGVVGVFYDWDDTNKEIIATATTGDFGLGLCVPSSEEQAYPAGGGCVIALNMLAVV